MKFIIAIAVVLTLVLSVTAGNNDNDVLDVEEEVIDYDLAADYDVGPLDEVGAEEVEEESGGEETAPSASAPESDTSLEPVEEELTLSAGNGSAVADEGASAAMGNGTLDDAGNSTATNDTAAAAASSRPQLKRAACRPRTAQNDSLEVEIAEPIVSVVNGSTFLTELSDQLDTNVTNRTTAAQCSLAFFYASWCPFSARAAPHFNGLARLFPDMKMYAIDTSDFHTMNTQFGIMALPTLILFHNSKAVAKYNQSDFELENFAKHVTMFTLLEPREDMPMNLTLADYNGPVPTKEVIVTDYYLYAAYIFTSLVALRHFARSSYFKRFLESIRNTWREAEIQHEHQE